MLKNFMTALEIAREQINDSLFMFANRTKSTYFTKNTAKMSFKDTIYFILKGLRKTLQIEIDDWFEYLGGENTKTKQAFSQLRQKIKPEAFDIGLPSHCFFKNFLLLCKKRRRLLCIVNEFQMNESDINGVPLIMLSKA